LVSHLASEFLLSLFVGETDIRIRDIMATAKETLSAATSILQGLARNGIPTDDAPTSTKLATTNGFDLKGFKLPGEATPEKQAFESELEALVQRVHDLELEVVSDSVGPFRFFYFILFYFFPPFFLSPSHTPLYR
jgi:hypothetical protein